MSVDSALDPARELRRSNTERLARLLCKAEGHDPDEKVMAYEHPMVGAKGHAVLRPNAGIPSWQLYASTAAALLDNGVTLADG